MTRTERTTCKYGHDLTQPGAVYTSGNCAACVRDRARIQRGAAPVEGGRYAGGNDVLVTLREQAKHDSERIRAERERVRAEQATRCRNHGHDLTLPGALYWRKNSKYPECVECRKARSLRDHAELAAAATAARVVREQAKAEKLAVNAEHLADMARQKGEAHAEFLRIREENRVFREQAKVKRAQRAQERLVNPKKHSKAGADSIAKKVWLNTEKMASSCVDCGYNAHVEALEFDHLPEFHKLFSLSSAGGKGWDAIKAERAKCEVVCANCHRVRTAQRRRSS